MCSINDSDIIKKIKNQFFSCVPVGKIDFNDFLKIASWQNQDQLLQETVQDQLNLTFPIKISYQIIFLRSLIKLLESQGEVHDLIYEIFCEILVKENSEFSYKHYIGEKVISLREKNSFISEATTGLCTWQASLALSEWILENPNFFKNKSVLELGSGVGLVGLTVALNCHCQNIILTDCHSTVLQKLTENLKLNLKNHCQSTEKQDLGNEKTFLNSGLKLDLQSGLNLNSLQKSDLSVSANRNLNENSCVTGLHSQELDFQNGLYKNINSPEESKEITVSANRDLSDNSCTNRDFINSRVSGQCQELDFESGLNLKDNRQDCESSISSKRDFSEKSGLNQLDFKSGLSELDFKSGLSELDFKSGLNLKDNTQDCDSSVSSKRDLTIKSGLSQLDFKSGLNRDSENLCYRTIYNSTEIQVLNLPWEKVGLQYSGSPNILLAADVVYDSTLFEPLTSAVKYFLTQNKDCVAIFACTERNPGTLSEFLDCLKSINLGVEEFQSVEPKRFFWDTVVPIRIFKITY